MTRWTFDTGIEFDSFRTAFEQAVPEFTAEFRTELEHLATWGDVVERTADAAPHGFLIFTHIDVHPLVKLAGHPRRCVEYLMGNHTIAERMYRHDPAVMLYVPLRVLLYADDGGRAVFAIDQPSAVVASLHSDAITDVGRELDAKVLALLEHLHVDTSERQ